MLSICIQKLQKLHLYVNCYSFAYILESDIIYKRQLGRHSQPEMNRITINNNMYVSIQHTSTNSLTCLI